VADRRTFFSPYQQPKTSSPHPQLAQTKATLVPPIPSPTTAKPTEMYRTPGSKTSTTHGANTPGSNKQVDTSLPTQEQSLSMSTQQQGTETPKNPPTPEPGSEPEPEPEPSDNPFMSTPQDKKGKGKATGQPRWPHHTPTPPSSSSESDEEEKPEVPTKTKATPKEKGVRPKEFIDKKQYCAFLLQLTLFLIQNNGIYKTSQERIMFTLGLFTNWFPAQFALLYSNNTLNSGHWGKWDKFLTKLEENFGDLNEENTAWQKLKSTRMEKGETATEFFQRFEIDASRAGSSNNDKSLIHILEILIPFYITRQLTYGGRIPPTQYRKYCQEILNIFTANECTYGVQG
jgi:hypothetical protein